jgi:pimeloyl-ACP methyl ester carboxylesterase
LLPGLICDQTLWQQQMDALSDVAAGTYADYGSLDSLPAMAEAVLRSAPERFSMAGHSMGGRVALEVYRLAPDRVARIALLNTGYLPLAAGEAGEEEKRKRGELVALAKSQGMRAMLRQWLPPMIDSRRQNDAALVESIMGMMSRKTPEIFAAQIKALLARPDATAVLEQMRCPALLLTGREDGWSGPAQHAKMMEKIVGSQLVIVPDCGHMSPLERPAEVSAALRAWLAQA